MNNPIYDEFARRFGIDIPENAGGIYNQPTPEVDPDRMPPENEHAHGGDE